MLTWGNFVAAAQASAANIGGGPDDAWLLCLPVFHIGGLSMVVRTALYGARLVMHPKFEAAAVATGTTIGLPGETALAIGLLNHALILVITSIGGLIAFARIGWTSTAASDEPNT